VTSQWHFTEEAKQFKKQLKEQEKEEVPS
jgi:hypothetical protein